MKILPSILTGAVLFLFTDAAFANDDVSAKAAHAAEERAAQNEQRLRQILATQPEASHQSRYDARHPVEVFEFFGLEPGMTVVEAGTGPGWYTPILAAYAGDEGRLIVADYPADLWRLIGSKFPHPALSHIFDLFATEGFQKRSLTWTEVWPPQMEARAGPDSAAIDAFIFGNLPENMHGVADVVVTMRVLHHFARFENVEPYFEIALKNMYDVLKPGGVVGVIQHRAPEDYPDAWAKGEAGYLKQSDVIKRFTDAGFEFIEASEINANPSDIPARPDASGAVSLDNVVWRLPPALATSENGSAREAQMKAVGESDRMTLKFKKPE